MRAKLPATTPHGECVVAAERPGLSPGGGFKTILSIEVYLVRVRRHQASSAQFERFPQCESPTRFSDRLTVTLSSAPGTGTETFRSR